VFFVMRVLPGDPVLLIVGFDANSTQISIMREELGLDDPMIVQFANYLKGFVTGNLGVSIRHGTSVIQEIAMASSHTLALVALAFPAIVAIGICVGVLAAYKQDSFLDHSLMAVAVVGVCIPPYFLALLLMLLFSVQLRWLPAIGAGSILHLILPSLTLAAISGASVSRTTRACVAECLNSDYVRTALAKGLSRNAVLIRHALRSTLPPIITAIGLQVAYMLGGAALVEVVYAYPGIGWLLVESISARDFPVIQAAVIYVASVTILVNLGVDFSYALADPKIRKGGS